METNGNALSEHSKGCLSTRDEWLCSIDMYCSCTDLGSAAAQLHRDYSPGLLCSTDTILWPSVQHPAELQGGNAAWMV